MRLPVQARTRDFGFNMTPMIDVVFLLIIFFLVSSHLSRQEAQLELALPAADSGQETVNDSRPRVTINLLSDGRATFGATPVEPTELTRKLEAELAKAGSDLEIRIRSDRDVPYRFVEPILIACARAGAWNVTFAVVPRESL